MSPIDAFLLMVGVWLFALGTVVGSFLNVCIYRIPWEKSLIWPGSHCPKCREPVAARDNIPIVSWLALRGACRSCGMPIAPRYALVELTVGLLFLAVFGLDVVAGHAGLYGPEAYYRMMYHQVLVCLLTVATFIDFDHQIIPDSITMPGMLIGLVGGVLMPGIRPDPAHAATTLQGLLTGVTGLLVGGGVVWAIRIFGAVLFRKEAMGFGDVTLNAMIGSFLGWRIAVLTIFLAAFLGLIPSLGEVVLKVVQWIWNLLTGRHARLGLGLIPFGPYLSLAAVILMLSWPWVWKSWARNFFEVFEPENLSLVLWFFWTRLTGGGGSSYDY